jgi:hypothetical protein
MDPITIVSVITVAIPFLTAFVKKLLKTDSTETTASKGINALIPLVLGILTAGAYSYQVDHNLINAFVVGLSSGGVASSARDIDKSLIGFASVVAGFFKKK